MKARTRCSMRAPTANRSPRSFVSEKCPQQSKSVFPPSFFNLFAVFFAFICRLFFRSLSLLFSPSVMLHESAHQTTRVRASNYSSPFAVGTRVLQQEDATRTALFFAKAIEINELNKRFEKRNKRRKTDENSLWHYKNLHE